MTNQEKAQLITEWLKFKDDAIRFGHTPHHACELADILVYGNVTEQTRKERK